MLLVHPAPRPISLDPGLAAILTATRANVAASTQLIDDSRTSMALTWAHIRHVREVCRLSRELLGVPMQ